MPLTMALIKLPVAPKNMVRKLDTAPAAKQMAVADNGQRAEHRPDDKTGHRELDQPRRQLHENRPAQRHPDQAAGDKRRQRSRARPA